MRSFDWPSFLVSQLWNLPGILIAFVAIILAVAFWRRHPGVSLLTLIAFALLLANRFVWSGFQLWQTAAGPSSPDFRYVVMTIQILTIFLSVVAHGLLIAAVFSWRSPSDSIADGK